MFKFELPAHDDQREWFVEHVDLLEEVGHRRSYGRGCIVQHPSHERLIETWYQRGDLDRPDPYGWHLRTGKLIPECNDELMRQPALFVNAFDQPSKTTDLGLVEHPTRDANQVLVADHAHVVALQDGDCEIRSPFSTVSVEQDTNRVPSYLLMDEFLAVQIDGTAIARKKVAPDGYVRAWGDFYALLKC
ncbi:MAG: hypothetical protein WDO74_04565 [Pseudomonadota bacterium]